MRWAEASGPRGPLDRFRCRRELSERAVRADVVVLVPPAFDQHSGLLERVEDLAVEQLVSELADQRLDVAVGLGCRIHPMRIVSNELFG